MRVSPVSSTSADTTRTDVYKAEFQDDSTIVIQLVVHCDGYSRQSYAASRVLGPDGTWLKEALVFIPGSKTHSLGLANDRSAGRLSETLHVMREEGHENPYSDLQDRAYGEDVDELLYQSLEILCAAHGDTLD